VLNESRIGLVELCVNNKRTCQARCCQRKERKRERANLIMLHLTSTYMRLCVHLILGNIHHVIVNPTSDRGCYPVLTGDHILREDTDGNDHSLCVEALRKRLLILKRSLSSST